MPDYIDDPEGGDDFKKKFEDLQSAHQQDMARMQQEVQAREQRATQLENTLASVSGQSQALSQVLQNQQNKPPEPPPAMLTEELVDGAGDDVTKYVDAYVHDRVFPYLSEVQQLRQQNQHLGTAYQAVKGEINALRQDSQRAREAGYYAQIQSLIPNYETVNQDPKFLEWLNQSDGLSGRPRQHTLSSAHNSQDARSVANVFNAYISENQKQAQPPMGIQQNQYYSQIAPAGGMGGPGPAGQSSGPSWTRADIAKFYADKARGLYDGKQQEAQKLERSIFDATEHGRVTS